MNNNRIFCSACGTSLNDSQFFCHRCGTAVLKDPPPLTNCPGCGADLADDAAFCPNCGMAVSNPPKSSPALDLPKKTKAVSRAQKPSVSDIIKKSVILAISVAMLVFAFLPVFSINALIDIEDLGVDVEFEPEVQLTAIDAITMFFDSCQSLDEDEIYDSDLQEEISELSESIYNRIYSSVEGEELDIGKHEREEIESLMSKIIFLSLRSTLQREETAMTATIVVGAVLAVLYVFAAIAFFTIALIDLIFVVVGKQCPKLWRASVTLLTLIAALVISLALALGLSFNMQNSSGLFRMWGAMSALAIISIVLTVLATVYTIIDATVINKTFKLKTAVIIKRSFSIAIAIVMICAAVSPMIVFHAKTQFDGKSKSTQESVSLNAAFFNRFNVTEDGLEKIEDLDSTEARILLNSNFSYLQNYTAREFEKGEANSTVMDIIEYAFSGFGGAKYMPFMAMLPLALILIVMVACIMIWLNLRALALNSAPHGGITIPIRILAIIFALVPVAIIIVAMIVCNNNFNECLDHGAAALSIGAGSIMALVSSIALMCIPVGKSKVEKYYN